MTARQLQPSDVPVWPHQPCEPDAAWRAGYEAGVKRRRLVELGTLGGVLVLARRHVHPLALVLWGLLLAVALSPLLVVVVAVRGTVRQHRAWRSTRRTLAVVATWLACGGLVDAAVVLGSPWWLVPIPAAVVAWALEGRLRVHRELRCQPPVGLTGGVTLNRRGGRARSSWWSG